MTLVAGVDSSTQSCKVVIRDAETGAVVRTGRASHPDGTEVDPDAWWDALLAAIADAGGLDDVAAISVGGQQHGMVVLDADGRVIRPALLWNDTRSAAAAADLIAEFGAAELAARTGSVPVASLHGRRSCAGCATPSPRTRPASPPSPSPTTGSPGACAASARPTRARSARCSTSSTTDRSDASGTGYWTPATGEYDRELLVAALGHDAIAAARARPGRDAPARRDCRRPGGSSSAPAPATTPAPPSASAPVAGDVVVSIGTSGTVFAVTDAPAADASGTVAGFADAERRLPAARRDAQRRAHPRRDRRACSASTTTSSAASRSRPQPGADGLVLQPYFEGERTPNLPDATATLFGMTLASTTRENLARAAIEGHAVRPRRRPRRRARAGRARPRASCSSAARRRTRPCAAIAAQVFDVPVVVPDARRVRRAAAPRCRPRGRSPATRPTGRSPVVASPAPDYRPVIREQYRAHAVDG